MPESQRSLLVESMAPRWVPEEGSEIQVVSRDGFAFILKSAIESEDYIAIGCSTFGTDDHQAVDRFLVTYRSPEYRAKLRANLEAVGMYTPKPEPLTEDQLREIDMRRADRRWRRAGRTVLQKLSIQPPRFLKTNWRAYERMQAERRKSATWYRDAGDIIQHTDEEDKVTIFVAADSEQKTRQRRQARVSTRQDRLTIPTKYV